MMQKWQWHKIFILVVALMLIGASAALADTLIPPYSKTSAVQIDKNRVSDIPLPGLDAAVAAAAKIHGIEIHVIVVEQGSERRQGNFAVSYIDSVVASWLHDPNFDESNTLIIAYTPAAGNHQRGALAARAGEKLRKDYGLQASVMAGFTDTAVNNYFKKSPQNPKAALMSVIDATNNRIDSAIAAAKQRTIDAANKAKADEATAKQRAIDAERQAKENAAMMHALMVGLMFLLPLAGVALYLLWGRSQKSDAQNKVDAVGKQVSHLQSRQEKLRQSYPELIAGNKTYPANSKDEQLYSVAMSAYWNYNDIFLALIARQELCEELMKKGNWLNPFPYARAAALATTEPIEVKSAEEKEREEQQRHARELKQYWDGDREKPQTIAELQRQLEDGWPIINNNFDTLQSASMNALQLTDEINELIKQLDKAKDTLQQQELSFAPFQLAYDEAAHHELKIAMEVFGAAPVQSMEQLQEIKQKLTTLKSKVEALPAAKAFVEKTHSTIGPRVQDLNKAIEDAGKVEAQLKQEFLPKLFTSAINDLHKARNIAAQAPQILAGVKTAREKQDYIAAETSLKQYSTELDQAMTLTKSPLSAQNELRKLRQATQANIQSCVTRGEKLMKKLTPAQFTTSETTDAAVRQAVQSTVMLSDYNRHPQTDWRAAQAEVDRIDNALASLESDIAQQASDYDKAVEKSKSVRDFLNANRDRLDKCRQSTREVYTDAKAEFETLEGKLKKPRQNWSNLHKQLKGVKSKLDDFDDKARSDKRKYDEYDDQIDRARNRGASSSEISRMRESRSSGDWSALDGFLAGYLTSTIIHEVTQPHYPSYPSQSSWSPPSYSPPSSPSPSWSDPSPSNDSGGSGWGSSSDSGGSSWGSSDSGGSSWSGSDSGGSSFDSGGGSDAGGSSW